MILNILAEIWLKFATLGGAFYGSLIVLLLLFFLFYFFRPVIRQVLIYSLALSLSIISIYQFIKLSSNLLPNIRLALSSESSKINQFAFAIKPSFKLITPFFNPQDIICLLWTWDTPSRYSLQLLYPQPAKLVYPGQSPQNCHFLISQFQPATFPQFRLVKQITIEFNPTYLYQYQP